MRQQINTFHHFVGYFFRYAWFVRHVLAGLIVLLVVSAFAISRVGGLPLDDAIYFTGITGLSIGYGDITPKTGWGRAVSVGIGLVGMIFTGMTVAVATRALADTIKHDSTLKR